ncbi:MAG: M48 family metallopeptidase [Oscillospiraceae bacterium]|nr:M48 family metallopeptidase [Oscillospiraceae bacterium]
MGDYRLIRSRRKSIAIRVEADGSLTVRAPLRCSGAEVERLLEKHAHWIEKQRERMRLRAERFPEPSAEEQAELLCRARNEIPPLVEKYAALMGVEPTGIRITGAKTRFGSCSGKNGLCFSWRLMRYPAETVEAVVVHELCHIRHKNHQKEFYTLLRSILPDYDQRTEILKE